MTSLGAAYLADGNRGSMCSLKGMYAVRDMTALIHAPNVRLGQVNLGGSTARHTDHAQHGGASDVEVIATESPHQYREHRPGEP